MKGIEGKMYKKTSTGEIFSIVTSHENVVILKNKKTGVIKVERDDGEDTLFIEYFNNKYKEC